MFVLIFILNYECLNVKLKRLDGYDNFVVFFCLKKESFMNFNYICIIILGFRFKSYFYNIKILILISEVKLVSLMIDYFNCL